MSNNGTMGGMMMVLVFAAIALVVLSIVSILGLSLVGSITASIGGGEAFDAPEPDVDEPVEYNIDIDSEEYTVQESRGYALQLTGADDSYVQSDDPIEWRTDDEWTVCTGAAVSEEGWWIFSDTPDETMTALSLDGELAIQYNGEYDEWSAWYYDPADRNSYRVNVSPDEPAHLSTVCVTHEDDELAIIADGMIGETQDTTVDSTADGFPDANWHGRLDQTRTFDSALSHDRIEELEETPTTALPGTDRTARLYYDEGVGSSTRVHIADTTATVSNAQWVDGYAGQPVAAGEDYEIDRNNQTVTALSGGVFDGAPAVWIEYGPDSRFDALTDSIGSSFTLLATSAIVIPAVAVLALLIGLVAIVTRAGRGRFDFGNDRRRRGR